MTVSNIPATESSTQLFRRGHCPQEFRGQRGEILSLLLQHKGEWVELPHLLRIAAQYNVRVLELRRAGFGIENRTARVDGQVHSWFRLLREPGEDAGPTKESE